MSVFLPIEILQHSAMMAALLLIFDFHLSGRQASLDLNVPVKNKGMAKNPKSNTPNEFFLRPAAILAGDAVIDHRVGGSRKENDKPAP